MHTDDSYVALSIIDWLLPRPLRRTRRQLLNWCSDRATRAGASWLRLDAWTANSRLHTYYVHLGFRDVRTVVAPEAHGSGWVGQRPARVAGTGLSVLGDQEK
ncbi:hypothetical protein ACFWP7_16970 [Streptomyces sp. NPDC058470]|uniref:hypothetical protein n=1 Tax=Streptomyces sp. NPDC058470 TaxID=3346515 RepID=UPI003662D8F5